MSAAAARQPQWRVYGLLALLAVVLFAPIASLLASSFNVAPFGAPALFGLDAWRAAFTDPEMLGALANTLALSIARQSIALVVGVVLAWMIARTDLPGARWLEVAFWIALFMPPLPAALAWVLLLGGASGLVNQALYLLPFVDAPVFNIASWWGIVWVHLMGASLAIKVFLLVPIFRALDGALEEAARASGASLRRTFLTITIPLVAPALIVTTLMGLVRSMQSFEVELILGAPAGIDVYSTAIYRAMTQEPPLNGLASALAIAFLLSLAPLVVVQQWYARRYAHASVTGRVRAHVQPLGRFKWPAFAAVLALVALMTFVPLAMLLLSTFMRLFGLFDMADPWTLDNWRYALGRGDILPSLWNTLRLGAMASVGGMVAFTLVAYVIVRSRSPAAHWIDILTWAPALAPGVVLSLGIFQVFTGSPPLRFLYGSVFSMAVAVLISTTTIGVQYLKTSLMQIGPELEEAGWISGGSRLHVLGRIVLPLIAPSVAVIGLEIFAAANAAVAAISLLGVGQNQPLSILQLNLLTSGQMEAASVVGFLIMMLTVGSAMMARWLAGRLGVKAPR